ncbi:hypothetical protein D3C76_1688200 [compost metagenome]
MFSACQVFNQADQVSIRFACAHHDAGDFFLSQRLKCFEATLATNNFKGFGAASRRCNGNGTLKT